MLQPYALRGVNICKILSKVAGEAYSCNKHDDAITIMSEVLKYSGADAEYLHLRACAYFVKGDFNRALSDCIQASKIDPGYVPLHQIATRIYFDANMLDLALKSCNVVCQNDAQNPWNIIRIALMPRLAKNDEGNVQLENLKMLSKEDRIFMIDSFYEIIGKDVLLLKVKTHPQYKSIIEVIAILST